MSLQSRLNALITAIGADVKALQANGVFRNGTGVPSSALGNLGDYYINDSNRDIYRKQGVVTSPSFAAVGATSKVSNNSNCNMAMPTGLASGNLLLMIVAAENGLGGAAPTISTPSGWTKIVDKVLMGAGAGTDDSSFYVFSKISTGLETTVTLSGSANTYWVGYTVRVQDNDLSIGSVINAISAIRLPSTTSMASPSITTTVACTIVSILIPAAIGTPTLTPPGTLTQRAYDNNYSQNGLGIAYGDKLSVAAGSTGTFTWTLSPTQFSRLPAAATLGIAGLGSIPTWVRIGALAA